MAEIKNIYNVGDEVYWNDPDNNISSGYYIVEKVISEDILFIKNQFSESEVFVHECI